MSDRKILEFPHCDLKMPKNLFGHGSDHAPTYLITKIAQLQQSLLKNHKNSWISIRCPKDTQIIHFFRTLRCWHYLLIYLFGMLKNQAFGCNTNDNVLLNKGCRNLLSKNGDLKGLWKFQDFYVTQNLREINFWQCRSSKPDIFVILKALTFDFVKF